jgi:hypothetical protein
MKKIYVFLMLCLTAMTVKAQVFTENFNGTGATLGGNVEGYNNWFLSGSSSNQGGSSPTIASGALSYLNYAGSDIGNVSLQNSIVGSTTGTRLTRQYPVLLATGDTLKAVVGDTVYAAFLVNIPSTGSSKTGVTHDIFAFDGSTTSNMLRGRIFANINSTTSSLSFGVSKNASTSASLIATQTGLDATHLLVLGYIVEGGTNNDPVILYVDPDLTISAANQASTNVMTATDVATNFTGKFGIDLKQYGIYTQIGGIRVGTSWNSVLLGISSGPGTGVSTINQNKVNITAYGKTIVTSEPGKIVVYNLTGSEVLSVQTEGRLTTSLPSGLYLVHFAGINGQVASNKVLLN